MGIVWSHSKLTTIVENPMSYYLKYIQGISLKDKPRALKIGSAVHWGIEHNTEDLSQYYNEEGSFKQQDNYTTDNYLAEGMVHGYLKHKDDLFKQILTDPKTGEKLELIEESHELNLTGKIKSYLGNIEHHDFLGIIDLLLLTNKGFIIIDYKTSSFEPDWDGYLDQIYRYIMLLKTNFPDIPVCKIGIINIRKTSIRQKKTENDIQFQQRIKFEYELNDENYINYHEFTSENIEEEKMNNYIDNLSKMCDVAYMIDYNKMWYINFANAKNQYGKSEFYDIFYKTPDSHLLYQIKDSIYDENTGILNTYRDCVPLDMETITTSKLLNKYDIFKKEFNKYIDKTKTNVLDGLNPFVEYIKKEYKTDDELLNSYSNTLKYENNLL